MSRNNVVHLFAQKTNCGACEFFSRCAWKGCDTPTAKAALDIPMVPRIVRDGEQVFRAGDKFETLLVVRSGTLKTVKVLANGEEHVTGFFFPGDILGVDAIDSGEHVHFAVAIGTSSICSLPYAHLLNVCGRSKEVQREFIRIASRASRKQENWATLLSSGTAREKVSAFLLGFMTRHKCDGCSETTFTLPMKWSDVASYLAIAPETLSRALAALQKDACISLARYSVTILAPEVLRADATFTLDQSVDVCHVGGGM